jgi:TP901 family phage tail tape measure protein
LQSGFSSLGRTATLAAAAVGTAVVGALGLAVKAAVDFDRSMRNVNAIAQLSEKQFASLSKEVLKLAGATGQAPKTLAEGLYQIVSSGFKAQAGLKILAASAKAATAGLTDTATATKAVVAILNAYGLEAGKAREVSDVLFQEVNLGVNTFEELAQNIGDTAPAAAALKVPFSEVSAALALITRHGTSMAEASTQVARILTSMIKPTDELAAEFKKMGYESGQAAVAHLGLSGVMRRLSKDAHGNQEILASWFGDIRGLRGIINLTGKNLGEYTDLVRGMGTATEGVGATQRAFAEQAKSISFQWQRAKASLTAAAIPLGTLLFPALIKAAQGASVLATTINRYMPQIRSVVQQTVAAVRSALTAAHPYFDQLAQAARRLAEFIRANWPQIASTVRAVWAAVRAEFAAVRQTVVTFMPLIRALAPLFKVAFLAMLLTVRAWAAGMRTVSFLVIQAMRAIAPAVQVVASAISSGLSAAAAIFRGTARVIMAILHALEAAFDAVRRAVEALSDAIRSIPTPHLPSIPGRGLADKLLPFRQHGGFVPGSSGDPVVILAHAGEVVLNQAQQAALGGQGAIANFFGFTGAEGPSFAGGGIVGRPKPKRKRASRSPHSRRRTRGKVRKARALFSGVEAINQREEDLDREYGQMVETFDISQETYIVTDPATGLERIDNAAIDQRLGEIDQLLAHRDRMLALVDEEKAELRKAIAALRKAIAALRDQIRAETRAARTLARQITAERRKKRPNENLISRLERQQSGHESRASNLSGQVSELSSDLDTVRHNLGHEIRFERRGVELDEERLRAERKDVSGTTLPPSAPPGGGGEDAEELKRIIGQLRLALGIQTAQLGIIGSFQKGTLHVPETGLAMVHAGERITPSGVRSGGDGGSIGDVNVDIIVEDEAMAWLKQFVRVEFSGAADDIGMKLGRKADERRRSGRF